MGFWFNPTGMAFIIAQDDKPSPPESYGSYTGILDPPTEGPKYIYPTRDRFLPFSNRVFPKLIHLINPKPRIFTTSSISFPFSRDFLSPPQPFDYMEGQGSLHDSFSDQENVEDAQDIEMIDVEEGELIDQISKPRVGDCSNVDDIRENQESSMPNSTQKKRKKKNKRKRGGRLGPNVTDINRFVLDACKHLRERKSYLMYSAVGCLGVAALSDLIKEVDAIQACGGQKTADGGRFRFAGGILWNIIKVRDPSAYKEIMTKGKEFEKQFKLQNKEPAKPTETSSKSSPLDVSPGDGNPSDELDHIPHDQSDISTAGEKRVSVHNRIRIPVTYNDDLLDGEDFEDQSARLK